MLIRNKFAIVDQVILFGTVFKVITCSVAGLCVSKPTDPDRRGVGIGSAELVVVLG